MVKIKNQGINRITSYNVCYTKLLRFLLSQKYSFKSSRTAMYPMWCAESVEGYLNWLKRSFHSDETIRTYKYNVYHFCDYLLNVGMDCFNNLEKSLILDYLNHDHHATVKGTSTRRTVLRQFVTYLEDNNRITSYNVCYTKLLRDPQIKKVYCLLSFFFLCTGFSKLDN